MLPKNRVIETFRINASLCLTPEIKPATAKIIPIIHTGINTTYKANDAILPLVSVVNAKNNSTKSSTTLIVRYATFPQLIFCLFD